VKVRGALLLVGVALAPGRVEAEEAGASAGVFERDLVEVAPSEGVAIGAITIDNRLGDVRVEGHDGASVVILALKRASDDDTLDRLTVQLVPDASGALRIGTAMSAGPEARPVAAGSVRIDLVVRAPRAARVSARVWNGRLELEGTDNGAELTANEGAISVKHVSGDVVTHSAAGRQELAEIVGAVEARGVIGDMDISVIRGERLRASVHEGDIVSRKVRARQVVLRATRGNVRFEGEALAGGTYQIRTYRGDVEVRFGRGVPMTIRARARDGTVELPRGVESRTIADGTVVGQLRGDAPAYLEMYSRHGSIQFSLAPPN
jgi:hypothetical protein